MKILFVYFGLACLISWLIWLPLYLPALGAAGMPTFPYQHALGSLGPLLACIITSLTFYGRTKTIEFIKSGFRPKSKAYIRIALLSPLLIHIASIIYFSIETSSIVDLVRMGRSGEFPEWSATTFFAYNFLFFGIGEEAGWRGFALPRLQQRYNALFSSAILTLFWAFWHIPLFLFRPGYEGMGIIGISGWLLSLLTGSILLTWLFNSSRGSILVCAIFHAFADVAFTSYISNDRIVDVTGLLITLYAIAVVILFKPTNLSSLQRVEAT